ncbi:nuclear pore complex protein Nup50 [Ochlerotatus camptorhynchus]|uniref:nuclear pore complex protein Nup50 n=1 Tax=Ochlerotatus camptorhynchus TaxID=644619 RepID=UPI0031E1FA4F
MGKMSKRSAQSDLNHDNWNEEEEPEEAGKFALATEDELKKRVIKTARRRVAGADSGAGSGSGSVFSGFKGFAAATSTPAATTVAKPADGASPFSFLSNITKPTNGTATATAASPGASSIASATTSALGASIFASTDPNKKIFSGFGSPPKTLLGSGGANEKKETGDAKTDEYAASIKALNQSVADWISDKVKENPLCKLTPIFKDYEKYLGEIEAKKDKVESKEPAKTTPTSVKSGFTFGSVSPAAPAATTAPAKTFSFGISTSPATTPSTGFTFANVVKPVEEKKSDNKEDADADEDEPPKVEFTPVEEKDSLYSKRCKLFVKVEGNFSDRGVGTVHIKKVDSKVQVLVRADTSLGNILLNIILNESVPLQRMGKNNVMMICLPTPDSKPPPTSVLLRVKTATEADELFETLNKYKPK